MFDVLGRLAELRDERGWTNYRLAKNSGLPQSSLITWFSRNVIPPFESIEKMCNALDISLSEFFDENEKYGKTKLAAICKQNGISSEQLAEKSGIPLTEIIAYIYGNREIRKLPFYKVEQIAQAIGCSVEEIT